MPRKSRLAGMMISAALLCACNPEAASLTDAAGAGGKSDVARLNAEYGLPAIRAATARFHSLTRAERAGYAQVSGCVARPGGTPAMGFHYENGALIDGVFDPLQPEALLYAPTADGGRRLVGVEYIVLNQGQARPALGSQPLDIGGVGPLQRAGIAHWSLHVWLWHENPDGLFAPFNPALSCS